MLWTVTVVLWFISWSLIHWLLACVPISPPRGSWPACSTHFPKLWALTRRNSFEHALFRIDKCCSALYKDMRVIREHERRGMLSSTNTPSRLYMFVKSDIECTCITFTFKNYGIISYHSKKFLVLNNHNLMRCYGR